MEPSLKDIRLLKEHDEYTYDKLRNYYINKLCYYIFDRYHFLLCDCQDLAEDIFVKAAYINIASYDPSKSSFTTWLFAIANNECLHFIRTNQYKNHDINFN